LASARKKHNDINKRVERVLITIVVFLTNIVFPIVVSNNKIAPEIPSLGTSVTFLAFFLIHINILVTFL
jgi:hypothetical protein